MLNGCLKFFHFSMFFFYHCSTIFFFRSCSRKCKTWKRNVVQPKPFIISLLTIHIFFYYSQYLIWPEKCDIQNFNESSHFPFVSFLFLSECDYFFPDFADLYNDFMCDMSHRPMDEQNNNELRKVLRELRTG